MQWVTQFFNTNYFDSKHNMKKLNKKKTATFLKIIELIIKTN